MAFWEYTPTGQIRTVPLEDQGAQVKAGTPEPFLESNSSDSLPFEELRRRVPATP